MTEEFSVRNRDWLERWESGNTGWHHQEFNPHLLAFWQRLELATPCRVLVPLCGKSRDMVWLAEQGHSIVGVELSPLAVEGFFREQGLEPERKIAGGFECWEAGPYQILCGDIFNLHPDHIGHVDAVYDRASLVALNAQQRAQYAGLLARLLPGNCKVLLVAMDYDQRQMAGPPYCVDGEEVERLFQAHFAVTLLDSLDLLKETERYAGLGLSHMREQIYCLRCD